MDNNTFRMRKLKTPDELYSPDIPFGSKLKVEWYKPECCEDFCVRYGDKIGWEDGRSDEVEALMNEMKNNNCDVYLVDDKVLALDHLYKICMDNIEELNSPNVDELKYGCILAYTDLEHKICELLYPELY